MSPVVPERDIGSVLLEPIDTVLQGTSGDARGLVPGLVVDVGPEPGAWFTASELIDGTRLPQLLDRASARWHGAPHVAAAMAWKYYSYWSALPAVIGFAAARRVPLLMPGDVVVRLGGTQELMTLGMRPSIRVAVLAADPLAGADPGGRIQVVSGEAGLLAALRASLLDAHLEPLMRAIGGRVRIGARPLRGSVSSGIATGLVRAAGALPRPVGPDVATILGCLGMADLVRLVPGPHATPLVQRRTCCLAFTLPEPKVCRGCCVRQRGGGVPCD